MELTWGGLPRRDGVRMMIWPRRAGRYRWCLRGRAHVELNAGGAGATPPGQRSGQRRGAGGGVCVCQNSLRNDLREAAWGGLGAKLGVGPGVAVWEGVQGGATPRRVVCKDKQGGGSPTRYRPPPAASSKRVEGRRGR